MDEIGKTDACIVQLRGFKSKRLRNLRMIFAKSSLDLTKTSVWDLLSGSSTVPRLS